MARNLRYLTGAIHSALSRTSARVRKLMQLSFLRTLLEGTPHLLPLLHLQDCRWSSSIETSSIYLSTTHTTSRTDIRSQFARPRWPDRPPSIFSFYNSPITQGSWNNPSLRHVDTRLSALVVQYYKQNQSFKSLLLPPLLRARLPTRRSTPSRLSSFEHAIIIFQPPPHNRKHDDRRGVRIEELQYVHFATVRTTANLLIGIYGQWYESYLNMPSRPLQPDC